MVSAEADRHEFLFVEGGVNGVDYPQVALTTREFLDGLPETSATFRRYEIAKQYDVKSNWILDDILHLLGSWKIPDYYDVQESRGVRWVNPHYVHRERYSDVAAQCRCGAVIQQMPQSTPNAQFLDGEGHRDDCRVEWRARAIAKLYEQRRTVLRRNALLARPARQDLDRLHLADPRKVTYITKALDLDLQSLLTRGYEKRNNTIRDLLAAGYSTADIAAIYGISPNTVRSTVSLRFDQTITELRP